MQQQQRLIESILTSRVPIPIYRASTRREIGRRSGGAPLASRRRYWCTHCTGASHSDERRPCRQKGSTIIDTYLLARQKFAKSTHSQQPACSFLGAPSRKPGSVKPTSTLRARVFHCKLQMRRVLCAVCVDQV